MELLTRRSWGTAWQAVRRELKALAKAVGTLIIEGYASSYNAYNADGYEDDPPPARESGTTESSVSPNEEAASC